MKKEEANEGPKQGYSKITLDKNRKPMVDWQGYLNSFFYFSSIIFFLSSILPDLNGMNLILTKLTFILTELNFILTWDQSNFT